METNEPGLNSKSELNYRSTRGLCGEVGPSKAVELGIAPDGGLFVPDSLPRFDLERVSRLSLYPYHLRAFEILKPFFTDFTDDEFSRCTQLAYGPGKFECSGVAPIRKLDDSCFVLELWHGPTCAFKDMALQLMPHLMKAALKKTRSDEAVKTRSGETDRMRGGQVPTPVAEHIAVLVATSGDTGKAALEGFRDVEGTSIIVFYPAWGVSEIQRLQMVTQEGGNVAVVAVEGNFDDAQNGVKSIFGDRTFAEELERHGIRLSSANSINWGRLAPQIVYYFSAYADMLDRGEIQLGEKVNFVVPTGNFGNILAAFYAKSMGLPIYRLVCATNRNDVLDEFFRTGRYDKNRRFVKTISPSMDILISSNLERLLYEVTGRDAVRVRSWMESLNREGVYEVDRETLSRVRETFWSGSADDEKTRKTISTTWKSYGYLLDPHTAVAKAVHGQYLAETSDSTKSVIVSTASPFKFARSVTEALLGDGLREFGELESLEVLELETKWRIPSSLRNIGEKPILHSSRCTRNEMREVVARLLIRLSER